MINRLIAISFFFFSVFFYGSARSGNLPPEAKKGVLNLCDWDLQSDGPVKLNGEWEFYWKNFYTQKDFKREKSLQPDTFIRLPGKWKNLVLHGKKLPIEGFATLRLRVKLNSAVSSPLAFKVDRWSNPFILYVNGKKVTSVGKIGTSNKSEQYDSRPHVARFVPQSDTFDIIMQVSNFTGKKSSLSYPFILGYDTRLQRERTSSFAWHYIIFGAIFVIGICLILAFFSIRPFHMALLYLGLACTSISLRSLFMGEGLINDLLPSLPPFLKFKLELSLLYSFPIFLNFYGRALFPDELKRWFLRVIWISHSFFIAVVILFNYDIALCTQIPHHLVTAFNGTYVLIVLGRAIGIKRRGALIFMVSLAVIFITALHDILVFHHIIETPYILHFGFLISIIIQTFLVTWLYSRSEGNISVLTKRLHNIKRELQELKENAAPEKLVIDPFCSRFEITAREREVIELIVEGASNNEIAKKLFISFHTVRRHLNNIYRKCDISERNELLGLIKESSTDIDVDINR